MATNHIFKKKGTILFQSPFKSGGVQFCTNLCLELECWGKTHQNSWLGFILARGIRGILFRGGKVIPLIQWSREHLLGKRLVPTKVDQMVILIRFPDVRWNIKLQWLKPGFFTHNFYNFACFFCFFCFDRTKPKNHWTLKNLCMSDIKQTLPVLNLKWS